VARDHQRFGVWRRVCLVFYFKSNVVAYFRGLEKRMTSDFPLRTANATAYSAGETPAGRTAGKPVFRLFPADLAAFVFLPRG